MANIDQAEGLRRMLFGAKPRFVTFLSALTNDEKNATLVNLAAGLGRLGNDVLLLDARTSGGSAARWLDKAIDVTFPLKWNIIMTRNKTFLLIAFFLTYLLVYNIIVNPTICSRCYADVFPIYNWVHIGGGILLHVVPMIMLAVALGKARVQIAPTVDTEEATMTASDTWECRMYLLMNVLYVAIWLTIGINDSLLNEWQYVCSATNFFFIYLSNREIWRMFLAVIHCE